jgi:hypothetical protein
MEEETLPPYVEYKQLITKLALNETVTKERVNSVLTSLGYNGGKLFEDLVKEQKRNEIKKQLQGRLAVETEINRLQGELAGLRESWEEVAKPILDLIQAKQEQLVKRIGFLAELIRLEESLETYCWDKELLEQERKVQEDLEETKKEIEKAKKALELISKKNMEGSLPYMATAEQLRNLQDQLKQLEIDSANFRIKKRVGNES